MRDATEQWDMVLQQGGSTWELYAQFPEDTEEYIQDCEEHTYNAQLAGTFDVHKIDGKDYMKMEDVIELIDNTLDTARKMIVGF